MYVAVKGGERAIDNAHSLMAEKRRGDKTFTVLSVRQIQEQLPLAVARVMAEGSLYDRELAALAIKQAAGDLLEAIFLLRAYRTTLARFNASKPIDTGSMQLERRISATYKDVPGDQILGPTFDYAHRLLDFKLLDEPPEDEQYAMAESQEAIPKDTFTNEKNATADKRAEQTVSSTNNAYAETEHSSASTDSQKPGDKVLGILEAEGLMKPEIGNVENVSDITREPLDFPADRMQRLQSLARGDEGFLMALAYSTQRGYGRNHPFVGEIRIGEVEVWMQADELGFMVPLGDIEVTECEMINQFKGSQTEGAQFTRGYGLAFGYNERKAMTMALVDRALAAEQLGEAITSPAQNEEFVLKHCDNVEAAGFVSHLKMPHYVDFQSELELIRKLQKKQSGVCCADEPTNMAQATTLDSEPLVSPADEGGIDDR